MAYSFSHLSGVSSTSTGVAASEIGAYNLYQLTSPMRTAGWPLNESRTSFLTPPSTPLSLTVEDTNLLTIVPFARGLTTTINLNQNSPLKFDGFGSITFYPIGTNPDHGILWAGLRYSFYPSTGGTITKTTWSSKVFNEDSNIIIHMSDFDRVLFDRDLQTATNFPVINPVPFDVDLALGYFAAGQRKPLMEELRNWEADVTYRVNDLVVAGNSIYRLRNSSSFGINPTDPAQTQWVLLTEMTTTPFLNIQGFSMGDTWLHMFPGSRLSQDFNLDVNDGTGRLQIAVYQPWQPGSRRGFISTR